MILKFLSAPPTPLEIKFVAVEERLTSFTVALVNAFEAPGAAFTFNVCAEIDSSPSDRVISSDLECTFTVNAPVLNRSEERRVGKECGS